MVDDDSIMLHVPFSGVTGGNSAFDDCDDDGLECIGNVCDSMTQGSIPDVASLLSSGRRTLFTSNIAGNVTNPDDVLDSVLHERKLFPKGYSSDKVCGLGGRLHLPDIGLRSCCASSSRRLLLLSWL